MNWSEFSGRFSRFGWFSKKEWILVFVLVLAFAFIYSFTDWGTEVFSAGEGLQNLIVAFVAVAIVVLAHHFAQRAVCLLFGFRPEHRIWWAGFIISLFFAFVSNGKLLFFLGSAFSVLMHKTYRLGWHRYGLNLKQQGITAVSGNIAVIGLICLVKFVGVVPGSFLEKIVSFGILFVFFNMLPIPPLDGGLMLLGSRLYFVFLFGTLLGFLAFYSWGLLSALFFGLIVGLVAWFVFYWYFEKEWMK
jgi:hypothetical protein